MIFLRKELKLRIIKDTIYEFIIRNVCLLNLCDIKVNFLLITIKKYTVAVVLLSIISLIIIIIAGAKDKNCRSYGIFAAIALGMMLVGAMGMNIVPKEYFGVVERFSVFAATGFNAVLGVQLFRMKFAEQD